MTFSSALSKVLSFAAIVTNLAIVGITSNALKDVYGIESSAALWLCLVLEHLLVLLKFYVQVCACPGHPTACP